MENRFLARVCAALLLLGAGPALADADLFGTLGVRMMDKDLWAPVEDQAVLGVMGDVSFGPAPIFLDAGVQYGYADANNCGGFSGVTCTGETIEWSLGVKVVPRTGLVRPFIGGGVVSTHASIEAEGPGGNPKFSDTAGGYFGEAGLLFRFARSVNVGLDVRYVGGTDMNIAGVEADADAVVVGVIAGYGWGGEWPRRRRGR